MSDLSPEDKKLLGRIRRFAEVGPVQAALERARQSAREGNSRDIACQGKKVYRTPEFAAKQAEFLSEKFEKQEPYLCPYCNCYHLATVKK